MQVHLQGLIFGELPNIRSGWPHRSSVARHLDAKQSDHSTGAFDPKGPGYPNKYRTSNRSQTAWWSPRTVVILNIVILLVTCAKISKRNKKKTRLLWISLDLSSLFFASVTSVPQEPNARGPPAFWGDCHRKSKRLDLTRQACREEPTWLSDWNKDEHIFSWDWFKGKNTVIWW